MTDRPDWQEGREQAARSAAEAAHRHLAIQYAVTRVLADSRTLGEAGARLPQSIGESLGWEVGALWTVDSEANVLRCVEFWHAPSAEVAEFEAISREMQLSPGIGLPGRVWVSGSPVWIPTVTEEVNFPRAPYAAAAGLRGALGIPIRSGDQVVGVVEFFSDEIQQPDRDLLDLMAALGSQIGQFMERKRAEEAARINEARKGAILEIAPDGIISIDQEGKIIDFNPGAERIFGYRAAEVRGHEMAGLIIPVRLRDQHRRGLAHYLATGEGPVLDRRLELAGLRADGTEFPAELTITRLPSDGSPSFTAFVRDITERARAENGMRLLVDAGIALSQSFDYEKTLGELAHLTVPQLADWCAFDLAGQGSVIERSVVAHIDPAKVELARELARRYPPDPDAPNGVPNVIRTGKPEFYPVISDEFLASAVRHPEQLELVRSLGLRSAIVVPLNARGRTLGALTLVRSEPDRPFDEADVTLAEQLASRAALAVDNAQLYQQVQDQLQTHVGLNVAMRQLAEERDELRRAAQERVTMLEQLDRAKEEFLATAGHDLKNPLTSIRGHAQLLLRRMRAPAPELEQIAHGLAVIDYQTAALTGMLDDLLDASRIQAGPLELRTAPCDLGECLETVLTRLSPEEGTRVDLLLADAHLAGDWERKRVEQVLANLVGNALKYSPAPERVTVTVQRHVDEIEVAVSDHGMGLLPEELSQLFERFYRTSGALASGQPGTGLGLYICRGIVEAHGGRIWAESPGAGLGATFRFILPAGPQSIQERGP